MRRSILPMLLWLALNCASGAAAQTVDWSQVEQAMGCGGAMQAGGVHRFNLPRSDLTVRVGHVRVAPALALGGWVAFRASRPREAVAMWDLVLTEDEYNRVIARLQQGGVGQTAVHKHLPNQVPALWWTHIAAQGDPVAIARTLHDALALTATPPPAAGAAAPEAMPLDTAGIHRILGRDGSASGGVYHVSIPRPETIRSMGVAVPASMGTATALNFRPTGNGRAAINGDFAMTADEVEPVIRALRENGIQVVSVHNHMLDETPRLLFMHFWANDDALRLARGLRSALDQMHTPPTK